MILKVKYYRVYDLTRKYLHRTDLETREMAEDFIKIDAAERFEGWRRMNFAYQGKIDPFKPSKYLIIEMVGTVESKFVKNWKEGIIEEFKLKD